MMTDDRTATVRLSGPVDAIAEFVAAALALRGAALTLEFITEPAPAASENGTARPSVKAKRVSVPRVGSSRTLLYDIEDPKIEAGTVGKVLGASRRGRGSVVAMKFGRETTEVPASWLTS